MEEEGQGEEQCEMILSGEGARNCVFGASAVVGLVGIEEECCAWK